MGKPRGRQEVMRKMNEAIRTEELRRMEEAMRGTEEAMRRMERGVHQK